MSVLAFDMGIVCYQSVEHFVAVVVALAVLLVLAIIIPLALLAMVGKARKQRDVSLSLRSSMLEEWWSELDADGSGDLDRNEIKVLLGRMKWSTKEKDIDAAIEQIESVCDDDEDNDGAIGHDEFIAWFELQLQSIVDAPFDVFYGTTRSEQYWWFVQVLWLKTSVNLLFTFGCASLVQFRSVTIHSIVIRTDMRIINRQSSNCYCILCAGSDTIHAATDIFEYWSRYYQTDFGWDVSSSSSSSSSSAVLPAPTCSPLFAGHLPVSSCAA